MKIVSFALVIASLVLPGEPMVAAPSESGGIGVGGAPQVQKTPEQLASQYYRQGVRHKEKAWKQEERSRTAKTEKKRQKALVRVEKEYLRAIDDLKMSLGYDLNSYEVANEFGYCLRKIGDYSKALSAYNHALKLKPDFYPAIEYRAEAYLALGAFDKAQDAYMLLFRENPELAQQLMTAMESWSESKADLDDPEQAFSEWVRERAELAATTADLSMNNTRSW